MLLTSKGSSISQGDFDASNLYLCKNLKLNVKQVKQSQCNTR